jgi:hypothetical protein
MKVIMGTPSEKQKKFLLDAHKHVAFGGARGGRQVMGDTI